jgi:hypothetical protein
MEIALSASDDLGPLVSTHHARWSIILARLTCGAALAGLGLLILYPIGLIGRTWLLIVATYFIGSIGVLLLIYALVPVFSTLSSMNQSVYLHSEGIVYRRWFRRVTCRWEGIEKVYRRNLDDPIPRWPAIHIPHAYVSHFALRAVSSCVMSFDIDAHGRRLFINSCVNDFDKLWPVIEQLATQRLLPKALEGYNSGKTLDFGRVQVSRDGISAWGAPPIAWSDVKFARVDDSIRVMPTEYPPRRWIDTSVGKIANVLVFVQLMQAIAVCPFEDRLKRWRSDG